MGLAIMAIVLMPPSLAVAETVSCDKAVSTVELNQCTDLMFRAADDKLNAAFKKTLAFVAASQAPKPYDRASWEKALRESQRAWLSFRDADCKGLIPMSWSGGTGTTAAVLECMIAKTDARTKELIAIYGPQ
jgi:uncharacterized protein YecT (DUF1311 family)